MARQEGACWRCGVRWASKDPSRTALRAIAGGLPAPPRADLACAEARLPAEQWTNEGGSLNSGAASTPPGAVAARG
jgi:hypothetical protein